MGDIASIDDSGLDTRIHDVTFTILSDVTNPLCGENGASYIYGPQKGATPEIDQLLRHYGEKVEECLGIAVLEAPGAGAAGGLGAGLMGFCGAKSYNGISKVLSILEIESHFIDADLATIYVTGIDLVLDIINKPMDLDTAISQTEKLIINAGETVFRVFLLARKVPLSA